MENMEKCGKLEPFKSISHVRSALDFPSGAGSGMFQGTCLHFQVTLPWRVGLLDFVGFCWILLDCVGLYPYTPAQ